MASDLDQLFDGCVRDIERAYCELGHTLGWRFLTGPRATLNPSTKVAFITLNPGGGADDAHQTGASHERGSSYVTESWGNQDAGAATLQCQVQTLFSELMRYLDHPGSVSEFLTTRVLTAHFIPFRSPSFKALHEPKRSVSFARNLWVSVLTNWCPSLILTIDRESSSSLGQILTTDLGGTMIDYQEFPTGWGQLV